MATLNIEPATALVSSKRGNSPPSKDDIDDTKSRIGDEYILVKKAKNQFNADSKSSDIINLSKPVLLRNNVKDSLLGAKRAIARSGKGGRTIKTKLFWRAVTALAANTAVAVSTPLTPSSSSEYAAFSGLFDEIKVDAIEINHGMVLSLGGTYNPANGIIYGMGYDSTYNTTPSSVADVLESEQSMMFSAYGTSGIANNVMSAAASTPTGLHKMHIKVPKGPVANATPVTGGTGIVANFPGEWMAVADTGDSVGYLRQYFPAQGALNTVTYETIVCFHVSFRERT